ncbi:hypothetical protein HY256_08730 [Candidatus Sumerlaeota bacterium]|nr:hypothetical protein [Candidatus Sumerlaeota bacterium]
MSSQIVSPAEVYVARLNELYDRIEEWMRKIDPGVQFSRGCQTLNEESTGEYQAPTMVIRPSIGQHIRLSPRGSALIGAAGRVDMSSVRGHEVLVYIEGNPVMKFKVSPNVEEHEVSLRNQAGNGWAWVINKSAKDIPLLDRANFARLIEKLKA